MIPLRKPVHRVTSGALAKCYGTDSGRPLIATLAPGDLITLRPRGTRRPESVSLFDVYRFALTRRINCERLEKARATKATQAAARKTRALARAVAREAAS